MFKLQDTELICATVVGVHHDFVLDDRARSNIIPRPLGSLMKKQGVVTERMRENVRATSKAFGLTGPLPVVGMFTADLRIDGSSGVESFYVLEEGGECLLGADTIFETSISGSDVGCMGRRQPREISLSLS